MPLKGWQLLRGFHLIKWGTSSSPETELDHIRRVYVKKLENERSIFSYNHRKTGKFHIHIWPKPSSDKVIPLADEPAFDTEEEAQAVGNLFL